MTIHDSDGLRWVGPCALVAIAACPQVADDDFMRLAPTVLGGTTAADAATDTAETLAASGCSGGIGSGGGCAGGAGGNVSLSDAAAAPDAGDPAPDAGDPAPDASDDCSIGVRGPNGDCYLADDEEITWSEARASCQEVGAGWDLASIHSAEENDFVVALTGYEAWLGATDEANEGEWVWVLDDAPFFEVDNADAAVAFTPWNSGEPNNLDNSDCLRVLTTGLWADWDCDDAKGHVCQRTTR